MTAAGRAADAWLFPVGHYLGPFHPARDAPVAHHQVRIGRETVRLLTEAELAAWTLAHGLPDADPDQPWSRQAVISAGHEQGGGADLAGAISELIADGALVEVPEAGRVEFASGHRFCPLLVGLGANPGGEDQLTIGLTGHPVVSVDDLGYQVWQWAHLHRDLWQACRAFVEVERRVEAAGAPASPERMLAAVLRRVRGLLAHGAGYLDVPS